MKREENNKQEQKNHAEQKHEQVIRVRSGLRAGAASKLHGCIDI